MKLKGIRRIRVSLTQVFLSLLCNLVSIQDLSATIRSAIRPRPVVVSGFVNSSVYINAGVQPDTNAAFSYRAEKNDRRKKGKKKRVMDGNF